MVNQGELFTEAEIVTAYPWEMTRQQFIESHLNNFVHYRGKRKIVGVMISEACILPMPENCQKNGKLTRPVNEVLGAIHEASVKGQIRVYAGSKSPYAPPWQKNAKPVSDEVLREYPHLTKKAQ